MDDPNNNNGAHSGGFMAGQGGSAIERAMARRSGGVTNQTKNGVLPPAPGNGQPPAPGSQPGSMPHPATFVPPQAQAAMQQGGAQPPAPAAPMPGQPMSDPSAPLQTVLDAMSDFVESQSKIAEAQAGIVDQ